MKQNYIWKFEVDKLRYNKYVVDLDLLMRYKSDYCAPIHEEHWADALIKQIKYRFTVEQIKHIAENLTNYAKEIET